MGVEGERKGNKFTGHLATNVNTKILSKYCSKDRQCEGLPWAVYGDGMSVAFKKINTEHLYLFA